ncbi:MAG TPA: hypothetical protein VNG51_29885 [Ktedonobacteraceae bacterium]|nr:hypothetical protein [Ktedonobacteraceae bacterium]
MGRTVRGVQVDLRMLQVAERPYRNVIQAIEPEAERLLLQRGGKVLRDQEGYLYEEYLACPAPNLVIYWPIRTRLVYLATCGQEDSYIIFMVALLPELLVELHLTYDYRLQGPLFGSFEEFFTLRVAQMRIFVEEANN